MFVKRYVTDDAESAEEVLKQLLIIISVSGFATVSDLIHLVGDTKAPVTYFEDRVGWTDLQKAQILETTAGYLILIPEPKLL